MTMSNQFRHLFISCFLTVISCLPLSFLRAENGLSNDAWCGITPEMAITINFQAQPGGCVSGGYITTFAIGGVAPYTFSWSSSNGFTSTGQNISGLAPGAYTVTVTDASGTTATSSVTLASPQTVTATVFAGPSCSGFGSAQCVATGGNLPYNYIWSSGNTGSYINAPAGLYTATVTDALGCTATATANIFTAQPILISSTITPVSNPGGYDGAVDITVCGGTAPYTYAWSNGNTTQDLFGYMTAGTYTVTVTDASGCTEVHSANITQSNQGGSGNIYVNATISPVSCGVYCSGSITLEYSGSYSFEWYGPNGFSSTSTYLSNLCAGVYNLTVTDNQSQDTLVRQYAVGYPNNTIPLSIQSSNPGYCNSGNVGGAGNCEKICPHTTVTYSLNPPDVACGNTPTFTWTITGAQSYSVSPNQKECTVIWGGPGAGSVAVTGGNTVYCYNVAPRCVTIVEEPVAKFTSNPAPPVTGLMQVCKGQTVQFQNQSLNSDLYEWFFSDDFSKSTEENPEHTFNAAGTFKITLISRSLCLCADTTERSVEVLDSGSPIVDCVSTICPGEEITYSTNADCGVFNWTVSPNGTITAGGQAGDKTVTVHWNSGPDGTIGLTVQNCTGAACPQPSSIRVPILSDDAVIEGRTRVCPGSEEVYTISPFGGGTYFTWEVAPEGTILDGQGTNKVTIAWKSSVNNGTADAWVRVKYDNCYLGCSGDDQLLVKIRPPFGLSGALEACDGSSATITAKQVVPGGQTIACDWTMFSPVNAGTNVSSGSPSATPNFNSGPGGYRIMAYPTAAGQALTCSDSAEYNIRVAPNPPKPLGITGAKEFCPGTPLSYRATGFSPVNNIKWTIKNSNAAPINDNGVTTNVTFTSGTPRWVAAAQVTADALGCISDTVRFLVTEIPNFNITGINGICKGDVSTYTAPVFVGINYQWEVVPADAGVVKSGQGTNVADIFWTKSGTHTVRATACGKVSNKSITVFALPDPQPITPPGICPGQTAPVSAGAAYQSYIWKDIAGTTLATTYTAQLNPGTYALAVTDYNGCSNTNEFTILEYPEPNLTITTADPTGFCNNSLFVSMVALTTQDADFDYEWYKDGVPLGVNQSIYTTNQYGLYSASVTNQYGCKSNDGSIRIFEYCGGVCHNPNHPPSCPVGSVGMTIDPTSHCDSFQFHLITGPQYKAGTAYWNFGESGSSLLGTSTDENPTFQFPNAGKYIVVMYAELQNGAVCKVLDSLRVEAVAQFSEKPGCPGDSIAFKDVSTYLADGGIASWAWNFGDAASGAANQSNQRNGKHIYPAPGPYTVQLTVSGPNGCTSSASSIIEVAAPPVLNFGPPAFVCAGNATPLSVITSPDITHVSWNFGDPVSGSLNTVDGASVFHKYNTAAIYTAVTTVENVAGCKTTGTQTVTITPNLLSGIILPNGLSSICEGSSINLIAPGTNVSYHWSTGASGSSISVMEEGVYKVTLTDANGCTFVPPAKDVQVNPVPDGLINAVLYDDLGLAAGLVSNALDVCEGENVHLIVSDNGTYSYNWSGGGVDDEQLFTEFRGNLLSNGVHIFNVTITNPTTQCKTVTPPFNVTVHGKPTGFSVAADQPCAGTPSTLTYAGPQPPNWQLRWNNGVAGPSFVTEEPGRFFVRVINEFGCVGQSNTVTIFPGPNIEAIPGGCHERCDPDTLCLPPLPEIVSWQWFLNGNPIAGATTPNLVATQSGTYYANVEDINGCKAQSDPLNLTLFTGTGDIKGKVWSDVNNNGIIDAGDTLVNNIPVMLLGNGNILNLANAAGAGDFAFDNIPSVDYTIAVNTPNLPAGWVPVIGQDQANLYGCDDVEKVALLVHYHVCQTFTSAMSVSVCAGSSFNINGVNIPAGQTQAVMLRSIDNCDSIVTVTVNALPMANSSFEADVCAGSFYTYNGVNIPAGQTQQFTLQTATGCDSIVTVTAKALPVANSSFEANVCAGSFYNYNGVDIPAGQTQQFTLPTATGCDSIVTVTAKALPAANSYFEVEICVGSVYTYNGVDILAGLTRQFTLQTAAGCDSIVTVKAKALPLPQSTIIADVCAGSFYNYNGVDVPAGETQQFALQTAAGCDSLVTVTAKTIPVGSSSFAVDICAGGYYIHDANHFVPAGETRQFTFQTLAGCDSLVTITANEIPAPTSTYEVSICPGTSYNFNGYQIFPGQTQVITLHTSPVYCDSIVTVTVKAIQVGSSNFEVNVCPGGFYDYNGTQIPAGQTQQFTMLTPSGCDSLVTVSVKAPVIGSNAFEVKVCPGESYTYNGVQIPAGQTKQFTLQTALGCDSLVTVSVKARVVGSSAFEVKVCPEETYTYNGEDIPAGQTKQFTLQTPLGCDSLVTVSVKARVVGSSNLEAKVCPGSTFTYNGQQIAAGQTVPVTLQTAAGCDSVVTVKVREIQISVTPLEVSVCPGETYQYNGSDWAPGQTYPVHFTGYEGCDSTIMLTVNAYPSLDFAVQTDQSCPNKSSGGLQITQVTGTSAPYQYSLDGQQYQAQASFADLDAAVYTAYIKDDNGCIFSKNAEITSLEPLTVLLSDAVLACDQSSLRLEPIVQGDPTGLKYLWWNGARTPFVDATEGGPVWVEVSNACENIHTDAQVRWGDTDPNFSYVYMPNVFNPEAKNAENNMFRPYFAAGLDVQNYVLEVYDRWGNMVFRSTKIESGWEGRIDAKEVDPGVYVWKLDAEIQFCGRLITLRKKGDVTVVR